MTVHGIFPDWPAPANVKAWSSTRTGGVSVPPYGAWLAGQSTAGGLNFGLHVGDHRAAVLQNRALLHQIVPALPQNIHWLNQVHGTQVYTAIAAGRDGTVPDADASVTTEVAQVCAIMTADCLPVLFCNTQGTAVAAAHAGWRGLLNGVLEKTVSDLCARAHCQGEEVMAWLGPAIGPKYFEVGAEVFDAFMAQAATHETSETEATRQAFVAQPHSPQKYLADIYALARIRLARVGIHQVYGGTACTVSQPEQFYSYRRDGVTGRMVSLIWLAKPAS